MGFKILMGWDEFRYDNNNKWSLFGLLSFWIWERVEKRCGNLLVRGEIEKEIGVDLKVVVGWLDGKGEFRKETVCGYFGFWVLGFKEYVAAVRDTQISLLDSLPR